MSLFDTYFDAIQAKISELREAEADSIKRAAAACVEAMLRGGVVHIYDTGHIVNSELIGRAGGLAGFSALNFGLSVSNQNFYRERNPKPKEDSTAELVSLALKESNVRTGDVLIVGSVSGKSLRPVELAIQARAIGVTVVALTALAYSSKLESEHPSGKRLFEAAEIVIDNHAPYGDAMIEAPGFDRRICPASGICASVALWALAACVVEELLSRGKTPTVYTSVNMPGGTDSVKRVQNEYAEKGY